MVSPGLLRSKQGCALIYRTVPCKGHTPAAGHHVPIKIASHQHTLIMQWIFRTGSWLCTDCVSYQHALHAADHEINLTLSHPMSPVGVKRILMLIGGRAHFAHCLAGVMTMRSPNEDPVTLGTSTWCSPSTCCRGRVRPQMLIPEQGTFCALRPLKKQLGPAP